MSLNRVTLEDALHYVGLSDVNASPDGSRVIYRTHRPILETNDYEHQIVLKTADDTVILEDAIIGNPVWTSANTFFASVAAGNKEALLVKYADGVREVIGNLPYALQIQEVLDENRFLLLGDINLNLKWALEQGTERAEAEQKIAQEEDDCIIADEFPYWADGVGITNKHRNLLFLFDRRSGLHALTDETFSTDQVAYEQETDTVYYTGRAYTVQKPLQSGLYKLSLQGVPDGIATEGKPLLEGQGYQIANIGISEGKLLFTGAKEKKRESNLFQLDLQTEEVKTLVEFSLDEGTSVFTDVAYGSARQWQVKDGMVYLTGTWEDTSELYRVDCSGNIKKLTSLGVVYGFSVSDKGIYLIGMRGQEHQELYWLAEEDTEPKAITDYNRSFYQDKTLSVPEHYEWTDKHGFTISGYVLHPVDQEPGVRYPAILDIHGGPRAAYGSIYFHEMQYWAANGYFVIFCNPTGSTGRGREFGKIIGGCGGSDYEDIMGFLDLVLEKIPEIDSARLGVTGGSYGGFMTNWVIGHTNRFAAAVSQRSTANNVTEAANKDIAPGFIRSMTEPDADDKYEKLWEGSPLRFIGKNTTTPTLFLHSLQDYRCYHVEALQMYAALQYLNIPTRMVLFKNEHHGLSRDGHPRNRIRRLREITEWMDRYLKEI